jgi:predicted XRE-type DNA-binding protein
MTDGKDDFELVRGGGNVFRDFGHPNADVLQLKTILAAKIIGVLDDRELTVRKAAEMTGIAASDFSRIRNAKLARFTIDRLMMILCKLDHGIEVTVTINSDIRRHDGDKPRAA